MSSETGVLRISPVNSHNVCLASIPDVPSKTYRNKLQYKENISIVAEIKIDVRNVTVVFLKYILLKS